MSFEQRLRAVASFARSEAPLLALSGALALVPDRVSTPAGAGWLLWDTHGRPELGRELSFGVGVARRVRAEGPSRFAEARARLAAAFSEIERIDGAEPRAFGGMAFEADGDLDLVLPRWTFTRSESGTTATLIAEPRELSAPEALLGELERLLSLRRFRAPAEVTVGEDGRERFLTGVRAALSAIDSGGLEKVVVVRRLVLEGTFDARSIALALDGERGTTRFGFSDGASSFVGATPELLVATDGARVQSEAVAGTLRRGAKSDELVRSDKDRREHDYVVQALCRRLAEVGVELPPEREPEVRALRHVYHLVTPLAGPLVRPRHVLDLVSALHPTPAVAGVPLAAARELLSRVEGFDRGWFAAPFGWVDRHGRGAFVVALRSARVTRSRAWLFAGSGVVRGSVPERELDETDAKLGVLLGALEPRSQVHVGAPP